MNSKIFIRQFLFLVFMFVTSFHANNGFAENKFDADFCKIYGNVFVETNKALANYRVFVEESESFADLVVHKQINQLMADRSGQWHFVKDRAFADFTIYYEEVKAFSNFSIAVTENEAFAGCK